MKKFLSFLFLCYCQSIIAQTLTISSAANSGSYAYNAGLLTISGTANIQASQIQSWLGLGNLTIQGSTTNLNVTVNQNISATATGSNLTFGASNNIGEININNSISLAAAFYCYGANANINADITTSTSNGIVYFKASGNIILGATDAITTNGASVVLWANSDGGTSAGSVALRNQASIVTGTSSVVGGSVWIGGGSGSTSWNGLTVGNGYAVPGTTYTAYNGGLVQTGVYLERCTIFTFGGSVQILGDVASSGRAVTTYGPVEINTKAGTIEIVGNTTNSAFTDASGVLFGIHDVTAASTVTLSSEASGTAIQITGYARGSGDAIGLSGVLNLYATGSGSINLTGSVTSSGSGEAIFIGNYYHGMLNAFAASGDIILNGGAKGLKVSTAVQAGLSTGPSKITIGQGGPVNSSTSDVFIRGDLYTVAAGGIAVNTSGSFTIEPVAASFSSAVNLSSLTVLNGVSSLTLGKIGNTSTITVSAAQSIAGPIDIYAGTLDINQNLTSTLVGADILLQSTGTISLDASKVIQTIQGDISLKATANGVATTSSSAIYLYSGSNILSNGGNITLGGGYQGSNGNLYAASTRVGGGYALRLDLGVVLSAAGGNILLYGKNVLSYGDGIYLNGVNISTTGSGTIEIYGESFGGFTSGSSTYFGGVTFDNSAAIIQTVNGNLTLEGILTNAQSSQGYAINFYRNPGTSGQTRHIQLLSQTGDIQITADRGSSIGNGIGHSSWGNIYFGSPSDNSFTASGDITLTYSGCVVAINNGFKVKTTGNVTYEPASNSFDAAQSFPFNGNHLLADGASSLILGKLGNTSAVTIAANQSVAGPIDIYAGTLTLNANLTTTNNGNINLYSDNPIAGLSSLRTITAAGSLTYAPQGNSFAAAVSYPITNLTVNSTGLVLGKSSNTANITFASATSIAGPITAYGGQITVNANLISTASAAAIMLRATNRIDVGSGGGSSSYRTLQTNNGDLILWSNALGGSTGGIRIGDWCTLNSANGSTTQLTGGGKVWLAGGTTLNASNLPTSPAIGTGNNWTGISLGSFSSGSTTTSVYSGGGDIYMCGEASANNGLGISWNRQGVCNAGNGTVRMLGDAKTNSGAHGIELSAYTGFMDVIAGGGDANNPAIYLKGSTERTINDYTGIQTHSGGFAATGIGGIYLEGVTATGNVNGSTMNIGMDVLSAAGPISLIGSGPKDIRYIGTIGRKGGSLVTSSSSNVLFRANTITVNSAFAVQTTGTLTVEPNANSFTNALLWPMTGFNVASTITGLTLGKTGNAANITVASALSVNGPITLHGGTLALNGNLTTTSSNSTPSNISLNGSTITGTPTLTLATGSTLTMNLSANTNFGGSLSGTSMSFVKDGAGVLSLSTPTVLTFIDFTISGGTYRLNSNQQLTLSGALTNNGTFTMRSGATFVPSATVSNISGSGTYNVQRLLTGNESNWNTTNSGRFWYMGVPVISTPRSSFGTQGSTTNRVWSYSESSKQYTEITSGTDLLSGGTGYVHRRTTNDTLTFSGVGANGLRGSAFTQSNMTRTSGASVGFHLVSNPYMAYVDWDAVTKTNIESTYYIRSAATGNISALISYNAVGQNYVNGGVSNITSAADVRYLAPMQAFWVRVGPNTGTGSLGMNTGMLSHQTNNPGLKSSTVFPTLARVNLVDGARFDQMLVFMNQDMSNAVDQYDAEKMFVSGAPQIYTMAAGKKLVMNGLRDDKKKVSVPLYLELPTTKSYELHLCEYQIEEGVILLEDKQEGVMIDFSLQDHYVFEASSGVLQNRFVLHFILPQTGQVTEGPSNSWAAAESPSYTDGADILIASDSRGKIQISVNQAETQKVAGTVAVTDANGKVVYNGQLEGLLTEFQLNVPSGVYYLSVNSGNIYEYKKVFVN